MALLVAEVVGAFAVGDAGGDVLGGGAVQDETDFDEGAFEGAALLDGKGGVLIEHDGEGDAGDDGLAVASEHLARTGSGDGLEVIPGGGAGQACMQLLRRNGVRGTVTPRLMYISVLIEPNARKCIERGGGAARTQRL